MFQWIGENAGTIIVSIALIALVAGIVVRLCKNKKQGKSNNFNCTQNLCYKHPSGIAKAADSVPDNNICRLTEKIKCYKNDINHRHFNNLLVGSKKTQCLAGENRNKD